MKKLCLSLVALICASLAWAIVDKTEKMTVVKTDGTTVEYDVADIQQVTFGIVEESYTLLVATPGQTPVKLETIPTVFRVNPANDGDPYRFGITTIEAATPADGRQGQYAVEIAVSSLKMNTADVDLAGGSNSGVTVTIYSYKDGEVDKIWDAQSAGKLTTAVDNKTRRVTISLEADYADGSNVVVDFVGNVVAADDLEGFNPPFVYKNQGQYFSPDGTPLGIFDVTGMTYTPDAKYQGGAYAGSRFDLTLSNGRTCWFIIRPELIGTTLDFATAQPGDAYFCYDNIQVAAAATNDWSLSGTEGKITVVKNEDNTFTIDLLVTNKYKMGTTNGGTPEYVILNYTSAEAIVEPEPEPEPEPVENLVNQMQYFNTDGKPEFPLDVTGITYVANSGFKYNTSVKGDKFTFVIKDENGQDVNCYVQLNPELVGKTVDLADAGWQSYVFVYKATEIYAQGLTWVDNRYGKEGTITITRNVDGSYNADLDISFKTDANPDSKESLRLNFKAENYNPEPEPEPEPEPGYVNQGQHFTADGEAEAIFDVTGMTHTENEKVCGVAGYDKFTLTLSNGTDCYVAVKPEYIGQEIDFDSADKDAFIIKYGSLNYGTKDNSAWISAGVNGKLSVVANENGSYTIDLDFMAHYNNWGTVNNTSKERVVLNYTPEATEPAPVDEPNEANYYNTSNELSTYSITGASLTENARVCGVEGYNQFTFSFDNSDVEAYIAIKPDYMGQEIDFATAEADAFIVKFSYGYGVNIQQGTSNNSAWILPGTEGKVSAVKNADGSYTLNLDCYNSGWTGKEHVIIHYNGAVN